MQDFSLDEKPDIRQAATKETVDINVSGVFEKDGKKMAYVSFSDGVRTAEGTIPDCVITKNRGFSSEETEQLEEYMKKELASLKKWLRASMW